MGKRKLSKRVIKKGGKKQKTNKLRHKKNTTRKTKNLLLGGCGCSGNNGPKMLGGYGAASMQPIPLKTFYPLNEYNQDPSVDLVSARNLPEIVGGRKRRMPKIIHGGSASVPTDIFLGNPSNQILTGANTVGAFLGQSALSGTIYVDPAPNTGPLLNINSNIIV